jgi:hypothetical protein
MYLPPGDIWRTENEAEAHRYLRSMRSEQDPVVRKGYLEKICEKIC